MHRDEIQFAPRCFTLCTEVFGSNRHVVYHKQRKEKVHTSLCTNKRSPAASWAAEERYYVIYKSRFFDSIFYVVFLPIMGEARSGLLLIADGADRSTEVAAVAARADVAAVEVQAPRVVRAERTRPVVTERTCVVERRVVATICAGLLSFLHSLHHKVRIVFL